MKILVPARFTVGTAHWVISVSLYALALPQGCGSADDVPSETRVEAAPAADVAVVAEGLTNAGAKFKFLQTPNGGLSVALESPTALELTNTSNLQTPFSRLYEQLANAPAPASLIAAEARAATLAQTSVMDSERDMSRDQAAFDEGLSPLAGDASAAVGASVQALSKADFEKKFCPSGYGFHFCRTNVTGNPWVQESSVYLAGAVNSLNCTLHFMYSFRDEHERWYSLVDGTAKPGEYYYYVYYGPYQLRRFEVYGGGAKCSLHFSVYGNYTNFLF